MTKTDLTLYGSGGQMFHRQVDDNFQRLLYYSSAWVAGSYEANELVTHNTIAWVCINDTTEEPVVGAVDWEPISRSPSALGNMYFVGSIGGVDLSPSWVAVDWMDSERYPPLNVQTDLIDNFLVFDQSGVYDVTILIVMEFDDFNSGRNFNVRIFNATDAVGGAALPYFVARNADGANVAMSFQVSISDTDVGKQFRVQLGNGDTFQNVIYRGTEWSVNRIV